MNTKKSSYRVVRDGTGWGVTDEEALLNQEPMTKAEAAKCAAKCNRDTRPSRNQPIRDHDYTDNESGWAGEA